ncbi:MAG: hypothetical protein NVS1B4_22790 [Gemmatimonadaceae bacterium]
MRLGTLVGIVLIVLGLAGFALQGVTYTRRRDVIRLGPIEASAEQRENIPVPPWASGLAVVAGLGLIVAVRRAS